MKWLINLLSNNRAYIVYGRHVVFANTKRGAYKKCIRYKICSPRKGKYLREFLDTHVIQVESVITHSNLNK